MYESLILLIFLILINLLFIFRATPIIGFPIAIFSFGIGAWVFFKDNTLPSQPYITVFYLILCIGNLLIQAMEVKRK